ncbi:hypothetical protein J1N35_000146 [Gossypium stocksii]|uniref:Uncharacterized protein n=1 Tax=Gossypium stocksii TaxID=47602 RepID=A0A9D3WHV7_9ROSI|nr:hypothetical protein J1N35_000146 [Gossypium stocksii]
MEKDFELQDRDVATEVADGFSSITFFDRIHQFIERKMAWTIVIKLLGKKIGFNALLNKVIDQVIGLVLKINEHTNATIRGRFTVCGFEEAVDFQRSKLTMAEISTGRSEPAVEKFDLHTRVEEEPFGPWMLVER